jgi:exodeoxyribonuclease VII small subunit
MTKSSNTTPQTAPHESDDFEHSLRALETLVEQLEGGQLPLAESLKHFEEGVKLARHCHTLLDTAQLTLTQLTDVNDPGSEQTLEGLLNSTGSTETSD